jgi:hypothetical protein
MDDAFRREGSDNGRPFLHSFSGVGPPLPAECIVGQQRDLAATPRRIDDIGRDCIACGKARSPRMISSPLDTGVRKWEEPESDRTGKGSRV